MAIDHEPASTAARRRACAFGTAITAAVLMITSACTSGSGATGAGAADADPGGTGARVSTSPPAHQRTVAVGTDVTGSPGAAQSADVASAAAGSSAAASSAHTSPSPDPSTAAHSGAPLSTAPVVVGTSTRSVVAATVVPNGSGPVVVAAPNVDGCLHAYGTPSQCIPVVAPGGGPLTCLALRDNGLLPLLLGTDPLHLATSHAARTVVRRGHRYLTGCGA